MRRFKREARARFAKNKLKKHRLDAGCAFFVSGRRERIEKYVTEAVQQKSTRCAILCFFWWEEVDSNHRSH